MSASLTSQAEKDRVRALLPTLTPLGETDDIAPEISTPFRDKDGKRHLLYHHAERSNELIESTCMRSRQQTLWSAIVARSPAWPHYQHIYGRCNVIFN